MAVLVVCVTDFFIPFSFVLSFYIARIYYCNPRLQYLFNMSSLTRLMPLTSRLAAPVRTATPAFGFAASRSLSSTTRKEKGAVDATKDTLKKVDRTVSDATLKGIETGGMSISSLLVLWIGN